MSPPLFQWILTTFGIEFKFTFLVDPSSSTTFSSGIPYPTHAPFLYPRRTHACRASSSMSSVLTRLFILSVIQPFIP